MSPQSLEKGQPADVPTADGQAVIDLTAPHAVAWNSAPAEIIDTTTFSPQIEPHQNWTGEVRSMEDLLPPHRRPVNPPPVQPANDLPLGSLSGRPRTVPGAAFPGLDVGDSGGWMPPDPTLAVGPDHIVTTVNQTIAFYGKDGTLEFSALLNDTGNPGFFEDAGAGAVTFDPKCIYDHFAQRFVVIAPEAYSDSQTAWLCIAISDDSNPHGIWYKYRTDCVITVGETTYWLDYPGLGYDQQAIYVTGNLFGLNRSAWGGVLFRIFNKTPLLEGDPATFADLRDGLSASVQAAQHFGTPPRPFFVSIADGAHLRIHAIRNPITDPVWTRATLAIPAFSYLSGGAPNSGGTLNLVDHRVFNVQWRNGNLYAAHHVRNGDKNVVRWYHANTNNWPDSGAISLNQAGEIDAGGDMHTFFPAIYSNKYDNVAVVLGACGPETTPAVLVTGRTNYDPPGTMGELTPVIVGSGGADGRWGDYFDIAVDPLNDTRFWIIGEYQDSSNWWHTWISDFSVISCQGDLNSDGEVGLDDLSTLLSNFGTSNGAIYEQGDVTGDGNVNLSDLAVLLTVYGNTCQ